MFKSEERNDKTTSELDGLLPVDYSIDYSIDSLFYGVATETLFRYCVKSY